MDIVLSPPKIFNKVTSPAGTRTRRSSVYKKTAVKLVDIDIGEVNSKHITKGVQKRKLTQAAGSPAKVAKTSVSKKIPQKSVPMKKPPVPKSKVKQKMSPKRSNNAPKLPVVVTRTPRNKVISPKEKKNHQNSKVVRKMDVKSPPKPTPSPTKQSESQKVVSPKKLPASPKRNVSPMKKPTTPHKVSPVKPSTFYSKTPQKKLSPQKISPVKPVTPKSPTTSPTPKRRVQTRSKTPAFTSVKPKTPVASAKKQVNSGTPVFSHTPVAKKRMNSGTPVKSKTPVVLSVKKRVPSGRKSPIVNLGSPVRTPLQSKTPSTQRGKKSVKKQLNSDRKSPIVNLGSPVRPKTPSTQGGKKKSPTKNKLTTKTPTMKSASPVVCISPLSLYGTPSANISMPSSTQTPGLPLKTPLAKSTPKITKTPLRPSTPVMRTPMIKSTKKPTPAKTPHGSPITRKRKPSANESSSPLKKQRTAGTPLLKKTVVNKLKAEESSMSSLSPVQMKTGYEIDIVSPLVLSPGTKQFAVKSPTPGKLKTPKVTKSKASMRKSTPGRVVKVDLMSTATTTTVLPKKKGAGKSSSKAPKKNVPSANTSDIVDSNSISLTEKSVNASTSSKKGKDGKCTIL